MGHLLLSLEILPAVNHPQQKSQRESRSTTSLQLSASFYDFTNQDEKPNHTKHLCHTFCLSSTWHLPFSSSFWILLETVVPPESRNDSPGRAPWQDLQCGYSQLPSSPFLIAMISNQLSQNPAILQQYHLVWCRACSYPMIQSSTF